jgi:hypothetical protein
MAKSTKSNTPPKPVSQKRLAANRANAARSTGPRTPEGKARSARNSRKHGFAATACAVVFTEEVDEVARLREDLIALYQPVNSQELFALERMAMAQISMLRAAQLEASLFTTGINDALADPRLHLENELNQELEPIPGQTRSWLLAEGFRLLCAAKGNDPWRVFLRYQAQAERNYRRALEEFERLKALRNELPNEPITEMQPEESTGNATPQLEPGSAPQPLRPEPESPAPSLLQPLSREPQRINGEQRQ